MTGSRTVTAGTAVSSASVTGAIRTPSTPLRASAAARTIISGNGEDAAPRG